MFNEKNFLSPIGGREALVYGDTPRKREEFKPIEHDEKKIHEVLMENHASAQRAAQSYIRTIDRLRSGNESRYNAAWQINVMKHTLLALEAQGELLEKKYDFKLPLFLLGLDHVFFEGAFVVCKRISEDTLPEDHLITEEFELNERPRLSIQNFMDDVKLFFDLQARYVSLLNDIDPSEALSAESFFDPETLATVDDVERVYCQYLLVLDPSSEFSERRLEKIHAFYQATKAKFEKEDLDSQPHVSSEDSRGEGRSEDAEGLLQVSSEAPPEILKKEGRFASVFRAPGRLLRLLFGAVALGGMQPAVHQFPELEADQPQVSVDTAPEVDMDDELVEEIIVPSKEIKVLQPGDSVWKVVVQMLRDRGLASSEVRTRYFVHQALVENGITESDALRLPAGQTLDMTHLGQEMDSLIAKPVNLRVEKPVDSLIAKPVSEKTALPERDRQSSESSGFFDLSQADMPAYGDLPSLEHTEHVMRKGESVYKIVHHLLRSRGLNWTTERINFFTQLVVDRNAERLRSLVREGKMKKMDEAWIPKGACIDFSSAISIIQDMENAKRMGKKSKTVRMLAREHGYPYPFVMRFPK